MVKDIKDRSKSRVDTDDGRGSFGLCRDRELDTLLTDQAQVANNMLKFQLENLQKETEYYKK